MADTGNGATITFGTTSFTAQFTMIGGTTQTRPMLNISHLGTTTKELFMVGDLYDPGEFEAEFWFNPNDQPPISNAIETVTITFPVPSGSSNGATLAGTAACSGWTSGQCRNNEVMSARATIKWTGGTGPTWTDAS